jgi:phage terminase small subunit
MKRGPKPLPTRLKILKGTRSDRVNQREPAFPLAAKGGRPPRWLGTYGRELWRELAPVLIDRGVLTIVDIPAFTLLCDEWDIFRRDPVDNGARDRLRKLFGEFGVTPSARSRVSGNGAAPRDELAAFLENRGRS